MTLGPFSFPPGLVVTFVAIIATLGVGNALAGGARVRVERQLWWVLGAAALAARVVFVARYWQGYAGTPFQALDIRDGGFDTLSAVVAGGAVSLWFMSRRREGRWGLMAGTLAGALALVAGLAVQALAEPSERLPGLTLQDMDGKPVALESLQGRPVVVNLWATWCPPCRREMPALANAQRAHPGIAFVFINQGESAEVVQRFLHAQGLEIGNVLLDPQGSFGRVAQSRGLPTTVFYRADGSMAGRRVGELSSATLAQRLATVHADVRR